MGRGLWEGAILCSKQLFRDPTLSSFHTLSAAEKEERGAPLRRSGFRIQCHHCSVSGHCCGEDLIPGLGTPTCHRCSKKEAAPEAEAGGGGEEKEKREQRSGVGDFYGLGLEVNHCFNHIPLCNLEHTAASHGKGRLGNVIELCAST